MESVESRSVSRVGRASKHRRGPCRQHKEGKLKEGYERGGAFENQSEFCKR